MKKLFIYLLPVLALVACRNNGNKEPVVNTPKSIVILYENDVHCAIDGYTKMRGLADAIVAADTAYVGLVSSGDFLQGSLAGAISRGGYIVDIMSEMHYDAVALGNHEFDYGVPRQLELLPIIGSPVSCANLYEYVSAASVYAPYIIKQYGNKRIAFVGVLTTETMKAESYSFYDKDGNQLYDLRAEDLYSLVQQSVDKARREGADYVVALSHLGEWAYEGCGSHEMIAATRGINVVLDGHTHSVIPCDSVKNLDGVYVPITQTGTQFANVGHLLIDTAGHFHTSLIPTKDIIYTNARVSAVTDSIHTLLNGITEHKIARLDFDMPITDETGQWLIRKQETALGNLVAESFRHDVQAQIGLTNAGGVRNGLKAGDVTYADAISVVPYDNAVCLIEATGLQIQNMLEACTASYPQLDGDFPQLSGLKFTLHVSDHSVSDVMVYDEQSSTFVPVTADGIYTIGTLDYFATGGFYGTLKDCPLLNEPSKICYDVLADYMEHTLHGVIPDAYRQPAGLITIVE